MRGINAGCTARKEKQDARTMEPANKRKENVLLFVPNLIGKTFSSFSLFYMQMCFHITCVDVCLDSSAVSSRV